MDWIDKLFVFILLGGFAWIAGTQTAVETGKYAVGQVAQSVNDSLAQGIDPSGWAVMIVMGIFLVIHIIASDKKRY